MPGVKSRALLKLLEKKGEESKMEKFFRNMKLEDFHLIHTPKDLHFDVLFHATTLTLMRIKKDLTLILEDFLNKRCDYES